MHDYRAPRWLGSTGAWGANLQTLWPPVFSRAHQGPRPRYRRERWTTPDDDFIDVDWLDNGTTAGAAPAAPAPEAQDQVLLVLLHGLEGSSSSSYALAFADWAAQRGWAYAVPHFRGCSGELNRAARTYHSGDYEEVGWMLSRFRQQHRGPIVAVGVSLGGNALLRWAQEAGDSAAQTTRAIAAVCAPVDLAAAGRALSRGFNLHVYTRMFLNSMKPKALAKLQRYPGLFDAQALRAARDLYEYDNIFTAPLNGFKDTDDYWARASAKPHLPRIRIPTLLLNPTNDPFIPQHSLPNHHSAGPMVTLWQPPTGGHVALPAGRWPGHVLTLPQAVGQWLAEHL